MFRRQTPHAPPPRCRPPFFTKQKSAQEHMGGPPTSFDNGVSNRMPVHPCLVLFIRRVRFNSLLSGATPIEAVRKGFTP
jgi:hypothetical protein